MNHHDCPGLAECRRHPRWYVFRDRMSNGWWVASPYHVNLLPTHAEAIYVAQKEAPMNIPKSAIEAAFESFPLPDCGNCGVGFCTDHIDQAIDTATAALTAALPYLEATLRKQIAAEQGASTANNLLGFN